MENFRAASYAVTAGIMLVIVMYIAYIAIPILILLSVMSIVYFVSAGSTVNTADKDTATEFTVRW